MRTYKLTEDLIVHCKNDKDCIFCEHCTDIFWDYTNGIYFKEGDNNGK